MATLEPTARCSVLDATGCQPRPTRVEKRVGWSMDGQQAGRDATMKKLTQQLQKNKEAYATHHTPMSFCVTPTLWHWACSHRLPSCPSVPCPLRNSDAPPPLSRCAGPFQPRTSNTCRGRVAVVSRSCRFFVQNATTHRSCCVLPLHATQNAQRQWCRCETGSRLRVSLLFFTNLGLLKSVFELCR